MKRFVLVALAATIIALPASAAEVRPALVDLPVPSDPAPPPVSASACATGSKGKPIACVNVVRDGDGRSSAVACLYDGALAPLGWASGAELLCLESTEDWGFIGGAGVCERALGTERPQACVNGRDRCVLWVMGVRVVCWAEPKG